MTTPIEPLGTGNNTSHTTGSPGRAASIGELFATLSQQITTIVNGEIELNKLKVKNVIKRAGVGGALLAVGGLIALYLLGWVFHTIELAIAVALPHWAAALITSGILCVLLAILAVSGILLIKKGSSHMPDPKAELSKDVNALKKGLGK